MRPNLRPARIAFGFACVLLVARPASGGPAADQGDRGGAPDYKVAFWYRRSDPLNTFRHRVYDVRKGQYTRAVDDWLRTIRSDYPGYVAYVKDVRLDPGSGQSEEKQLASLIIRENLARGGPDRGFGLHDPYGLYGGASLEDLLNPRVVEAPPRVGRPSSEVSRYFRGYGFISTPGASRTPLYPNNFNFNVNAPYQNPPSLPTPFPYPYVRPHP